VTLAVPGRYEVAAGDTQDPTVVTVVEGSAHVEGPGVSLDVGPGQAANITGTDAFQGEVGSSQRDAFLAAMLAGEPPPQAPPRGGGGGRGGGGPRRGQGRRPRGATPSPSPAPGARAPTTARFGPRRLHRAGRRIVTDPGPMSRHGAGPGWTVSRGASHRSIMVA